MNIFKVTPSVFEAWCASKREQQHRGISSIENKPLSESEIVSKSELTKLQSEISQARRKLRNEKKRNILLTARVKIAYL